MENSPYGILCIIIQCVLQCVQHDIDPVEHLLSRICFCLPIAEDHREQGDACIQKRGERGKFANAALAVAPLEVVPGLGEIAVTLQGEKVVFLRGLFGEPLAGVRSAGKQVDPHSRASMLGRSCFCPLSSIRVRKAPLMSSPFSWRLSARAMSGGSPPRRRILLAQQSNDSRSR